MAGLVLIGSSASVLPAFEAWAAGASRDGEFTPYEETLPNTNVSFEMVPVPAGKFLMGSPDGEAGREPDEGPQIEVKLGAFWIGKHEVTWDEYDLFAFGDIEIPDHPLRAAADPSGADALTQPTPTYGDESFGYGKGRRPAISMTHHAAMEYCRWLSAKTGKLYRLPTEAEWEYAARAGTQTAYSFGDDPAKLDEHAWHADNSDGRPQPVGGKQPNAWGLHDMHGNVAEWVVDEYQEDRYAALKAGAPVFAPVLLPGERRYPHVVRGGSWDDDPERLRSAARHASELMWSRRDPQRPQSIWWHTEATFVGFRIVRALEEQPELRALRSKVTRDSPN
jgi:formylglycine-generating enzyme required for sulfatase activity